MRFHLLALPGRPTTRENSACAYTQKVRKFAAMMTARGHEVYLYGGPDNDADCTEYVACYSPELGPLPFEPRNWADSNARAAAAIRERMEIGDVLCLIAGRCQQELAEALPEIRAVEFGIGYGGVFAPFKVFESYAWMHMVYGARAGDPHAADGAFFDAVIPNYFDLDDFPFDSSGNSGDDYLLYVGRMIERKGVHVAADVAEHLGLPLFLAGEGDEVPSYGEHIGHVGPEQRAELMAGARALLAPTLYVEPFGGAAIEAMLCGTPAITTDWGAYTETIRPGFNGYRCRTLGEFVWAVEHADDLDPTTIRDHAAAEYSLDAIAPRYETYFEQLGTLDGEGFYDMTWEGLSRRRGGAPRLG